MTITVSTRELDRGMHVCIYFKKSFQFNMSPAVGKYDGRD